jgi:hypothetical protein
MTAIFISYRRADAQAEARLLHRNLVDRFGKPSVFMDVTDIAKGRDFREVLDEQLARCRVALIVIGVAWLEPGANGKRRIDDPDDLVRLEVATALRKPNLPVIPILVRGVRMPKPNALPEEIQDLVFRDGVELTHPRWDSDVSELVKAIEPYVGDARPEERKPAHGHQFQGDNVRISGGEYSFNDGVGQIGEGDNTVVRGTSYIGNLGGGAIFRGNNLVFDDVRAVGNGGGDGLERLARSRDVIYGRVGLPANFPAALAAEAMFAMKNDTHGDLERVVRRLRFWDVAVSSGVDIPKFINEWRQLDGPDYKAFMWGYLPNGFRG